MIEIVDDRLVASFPEVHPNACLRISLMRTLRLPDDTMTRDLPADLGRYTLTHVDDHVERIPETWLRRGGVLLPIRALEAVCVKFESEEIADVGLAYPFAVMIAFGKICVVSGMDWRDTIIRRPRNYIVVPSQTRLDGFKSSPGIVKQFVALPTDDPRTVENKRHPLDRKDREPIGGLQIAVFPMTRSAFNKMAARLERDYEDAGSRAGSVYEYRDCGAGRGAKIRERIAPDPHGPAAWDLEARSRCFVHLVEADEWRKITDGRATTNQSSAIALPSSTRAGDKVRSGATGRSSLRSAGGAEP